MRPARPPAFLPQALPSAARSALLLRIADALVAAQDEILAANARDVAEAGDTISDALMQRLVLKVGGGGPGGRVGA